MFLLNQLTEFNSESYCKAHFKTLRESATIKCKKCQKTEHYWLSGKSQWQCKGCKFRTTLKSGTIMENSKMTFRKWYQTMIMMSATKKGISAKEMQKQFGAKRYESTWSLIHKVRKAMGQRDSIYTLKDQVELDEGYFTVETSLEIKKGQKAGRGSVTVVPVSVIVEATRLENIETNETSSHCGHLKMQFIENHKGETIGNVVAENVKDNAIAFTDCSTSYTQLEKLVEGHHATKSTAQTTKSELKWVHTVISNAKRVFNGIHHKINKKYIQNYLDEFTYKFNRRYFGDRLFERLAIAVAVSKK